MGKKNCELTPDDIKQICDTFLAFKETEQSKVFPNAAFGYWKVTVERPLRLRVDLAPKVLADFRKACDEAGEEPLAKLTDRLVESLGPGPYLDYNMFLSKAEEDADKHGVKLTAKRLKLLQNLLAQRDEQAVPVVKRVHKAGKATVDPIRGRYANPVGDKKLVIEYEPDSELRDTEQIPLLEEGGIEAFLEREVLQHAPDAWFDDAATRIGYEVSFNRYFFKPKPLRSLEEIRADILMLEAEMVLIAVAIDRTPILAFTFEQGHLFLGR